jgi:ankyrin repeat protein
VEKGADVNIPNFERITPLHFSVYCNNVICAKHFVKFGANISYQGLNNITTHSMAVVNILVENRDNINLRDDLGNTALHVAVEKAIRVLFTI